MIDLDRDPELRRDVEKALAQAGLALLARPGVPYFGVALAGTYRSSDHVPGHSLNIRDLGLLLYLWLRVVAPAVYSSERIPEQLNGITISRRALLRDLPGGWSETTLDRELSRLRNLNFVENVRGKDEIAAGPMLWLAIDHTRLSRLLREEKGLPMAVQRFLRGESAEEAVT
jgi:hypothetical protein